VFLTLFPPESYRDFPHACLPVGRGEGETQNFSRLGETGKGVKENEGILNIDV